MAPDSKPDLADCGFVVRGRYLSRMFFVKFVMKLIYLLSGFLQGFPANGGDLVNPSLASSNISQYRLQQTASLQAMQEWVEGARANAISMMRQLLHHGQSKDWLMGSMHQYMNPYESEVEFPLLFQHNVNIPS